MGRRSHYHPSRCWSCDARVDDGVHISQTGLCPPCGLERMVENYDQLKDKTGPHYRYWRRRIREGVERLLVDDGDAAA